MSDTSSKDTIVLGIIIGIIVVSSLVVAVITNLFADINSSFAILGFGFLAVVLVLIITIAICRQIGAIIKQL